MNRSADRPVRTHRSGPRPPSLAGNLWTLLALLALLALSAGSAMLKLGPFNTVANLGIAMAKALLVLTIFMRLKTDNALLRIVAGVGFAWLAVMIALSLADVLTRAPLLAPW
ncbi:MAG TPA: cytochrome C oxidase subunit IV family protein [Frateuria sp.]|uniref:cytochrome C oxidase subunit IV family protein n=1 Tax=Frateuria sp. TaxID=2211372 RepID=UPI002D7F9FF3|nr:cytochrome C oxidase subunit IV family protein [Frateuria sp.]HET6806396.1 cytochrome C oxidase subunit IV family protein [Frateuria sp.]